MSFIAGFGLGALVLFLIGIIIEFAFGYETACRVMYSLWGLAIALFLGSFFAWMVNAWRNGRSDPPPEKA